MLTPPRGRERDSRMRILYLPNWIAILVLLPALICSCANPSHLVFVQSTVLGVDVAVSPETKNAKVVVGYDRQTDTIIPTSKIETAANQRENEALSVIGATKIDLVWFGHQKISENFATGIAAEHVAADPKAIDDLLKPKTETAPGTEGKVAP